MPIKRRNPKARRFKVTNEILEAYRFVRDGISRTPDGHNAFFKLMRLCGLELNGYGPLPIDGRMGSYGVARKGLPPSNDPPDQQASYVQAQAALNAIEAELRSIREALS